MATAVLEMAVPGAGSAADVLMTIAKLCADMKEGQAACRRLHGRLVDITDEMTRMRDRGHLPNSGVLERYVNTLTRYLRYLERYSRRPLVSRVIRHYRMMDELQQLNEDVDAMFKMLNLATTAKMMEWKEQWEAEARTQKDLLVAAATNDAMLLSEFRSQRAQMDAMMVLKLEVDRNAIVDTIDKTRDMSPHVREMFLTMVRASKVPVPQVPEWLIPPDDVEFDPKPFAHGSFGTLHSGVWGSGTKVVLKCLAIREGKEKASLKSQQKFVEEIEVWHKLSHPNVLKMFGASHVFEDPFIVCEDATMHGNLGDYLKRNGKKGMWQLILQAAFGLEYIHSKGIVHGDLILNNILVGNDGMAKVADFGLSSVCTPTTKSTDKDKDTEMKKKKKTKPKPKPKDSQANTLQPLRTNPRWSAPECLVEKPTPLSDVYSLAMCIIEAVLGEPPWATLDDDAIIRLLKDGKMPDRPAGMSNRVWNLVKGMTHSTPAKRQSLSKVIERLKELVALDSQVGASSEIQLELDEIEVRPPESLDDGNEFDQNEEFDLTDESVFDVREVEIQENGRKGSSQDTCIGPLIQTIRDSSEKNSVGALYQLYQMLKLDPISYTTLECFGEAVEPLLDILRENGRSEHQKQVSAQYWRDLPTMSRIVPRLVVRMGYHWLWDF